MSPMTISTAQLIVHGTISLALIASGLVLTLTGNISSGEGIGLIGAGAAAGGVGTLAATAIENPKSPPG